MHFATKIPGIVTSFSGEAANFGDDIRTQGSILNLGVYKKQEIKSGNRCGQVPGSPRFYNRPPNHKPNIHPQNLAALGGHHD